MCRMRLSIPPIICDPLDVHSNQDNELVISAAGSKPVLNLAADEQKTISIRVSQLLDRN